MVEEDILIQERINSENNPGCRWSKNGGGCWRLYEVTRLKGSRLVAKLKGCVTGQHQSLTAKWDEREKEIINKIRTSGNMYE